MSEPPQIAGSPAAPKTRSTATEANATREPQPTSRGRASVSIVGVVLLYLALAIGFQRSVPLFEAPDEPSHIEYAAFIAREGRPSRLGPTPEVPGEGMQPPLFHVLLAPFVGMIDVPGIPFLEELHNANLWIYRIDERALLRNRHLVNSNEPIRMLATNPRLDVFKRLRWPTLGFGLVTVLLTYAATRRVVGDREVAALAATFVGLNPQFIFVSSYVNNDTAATALSAAAFWLAAGAIRDRRSDWKRYLGMALLCSAGVATKTSTLPSLFVSSLAIFLSDRRNLAIRGRDALLAVGAGLVVASPYLIWNVVTRGGPLGMQAVWETTAPFAGPESVGGLRAYFSGPYWVWTFQSFWGVFGWRHIYAPPPFYLAFGVIAGVGAAGFALSWRPRRPAAGGSQPGASPGLGELCLYLSAVFGLTLAAHIWINVHELMPQGRHLFPAAPQLGCLLALGYAHWSSGDGKHVSRRTTFAVTLAMAALALYCLVAVIQPRYPDIY